MWFSKGPSLWLATWKVLFEGFWHLGQAQFLNIPSTFVFIHELLFPAAHLATPPTSWPSLTPLRPESKTLPAPQEILEFTNHWISIPKINRNPPIHFRRLYPLGAAPSPFAWKKSPWRQPHAWRLPGFPEGAEDSGIPRFLVENENFHPKSS